MRLGFVPHLWPENGGAYQYGVALLRCVSELADARGDELCVLADRVDDPALPALSGRTTQVLPLKRHGPARWSPWYERIARRAWTVVSPRRSEPLAPAAPPAVDSLGPRFRHDVQNWFATCGVELMVYAHADALSFETRVPYVLPIHDLQHRVQPQFPEVSADGEWEAREYLFRNAAGYATLLLAGSEVGKAEILEYYGEFGVSPDRVHVVPFVPACTLDQRRAAELLPQVRAARALPPEFLLYPAQFWPHKNHCRIVQALAELRRTRGLAIPLVLTGSHSGALRERTWRAVMSEGTRLGVRDLIHDLGYVTSDELAALYRGARGLVIPTFFGPTLSIPVLEAWAFDVPVLTSNIRGVREQVGTAGILVEPSSVAELVSGIAALWLDETRRRALIAAGRRQLAEHSQTEFRARIADVLTEATERAEREGPRRPAVTEALPRSAQRSARHVGAPVRVSA